MYLNEDTLYVVERVDFDHDACTEVLYLMEDDPELNRDQLLDECSTSEVLGQIWASTANEAIEKVAAEWGYRHSGHWLEFLNSGDCLVSFRAIPIEGVQNFV